MGFVALYDHRKFLVFDVLCTFEKSIINRQATVPVFFVGWTDSYRNGSATLFFNPQLARTLEDRRGLDIGSFVDYSLSGCW